MKLKVMLCLSIVSLLFVGTAFAFDNEPDGFHGIKWGTPFSVHAKELMFVDNGEDEDFYLRKGDDMTIGAAKLDRIMYGYWKDQFMSVIIEASGEGNRSAILEVFRTQFGTGQKTNQGPDMYYWRGTTTTMSISCLPKDEKCRAFLISTVLFAKQKEEKKKTATGATKN